MPESRERDLPLLLEHRGEYSSLWTASESIASKIGGVPQTSNKWVRKLDVEAGARPGIISDERERAKALER